MKLKGFDWHPPAAGSFPAWEPKPPAVVVHRRRGRVVLKHGGDETCSYCEAVAAKAAAAEPQLFSYPTRPWKRDGGENAANLPNQRPRTVFSHRLMNSKSLDDAIAIPTSLERKLRKEPT